ncbi:hypothetical protein B0J13DRAFT_133585 [Dactylonectria estremocensis]|uniref:Uncharacterized protein n=1 Tax=Dactylonectria estremocensis TaxID=1079267 RepID=A0A9P9E3C5_9HYPO|nr:hypothetical protein B0J13DRAFT_133585 [Dactylonectria estremocensis]
MKPLDLPILYEIRAIRGLMGHWKRHCETIESPYDIFDRQLAALYELGENEITSARDSGQPLVKRFMDLGIQKGELLRNHNAAIASDEIAYSQALELRRFHLLRQLGGIVGMEVFGAVANDFGFQLIRKSELPGNPISKTGESTPEQDLLPPETRDSEASVQVHDDAQPGGEMTPEEVTQPD